MKADERHIGSGNRSGGRARSRSDVSLYRRTALHRVAMEPAFRAVSHSRIGVVVHRWNHRRGGRKAYRPMSAGASPDGVFNRSWIASSSNTAITFSLASSSSLVKGDKRDRFGS